jgi:hypothetical protein
MPDEAENVVQMLYENKIDWAEPNETVPLAFTQSKFKSAILDYQIPFGILKPTKRSSEF